MRSHHVTLGNQHSGSPRELVCCATKATGIFSAFGFDSGIGYVDINGYPVERTPQSHPYSYSAFCVWKGDFNPKTDHGVYTDRLWEWDYKLYDRCCEEVWHDHAQFFYSRKPPEIQRFLSLYLKKPVILTGVEQCCNVSNGFPIWILYYRDANTVTPAGG